MQQDIEIQLQNLLQEHNITFREINLLPASGGDRKYFLIKTEKEPLIGTFGNNEKENQAFFYFTKILNNINAPVPNIICSNTSKTIYVQSFNGNTSLLDCVLEQGHTPTIFEIYKEVILQLINVQINAHKIIDYNNCIGINVFDENLALRDLNYFKENFIDLHNIVYDTDKLKQEFNAVAQLVKGISPIYFLYRDFQGRNILLNSKNQITFIDYQAGMQGPLQYDLVSLLWQAKANLPEAWKQELVEFYFQNITNNYGIEIDKNTFLNHYHILTLLRLLQVLGAYGLRGLKEKKQHFLSSIYQGLQNISSWKASNNFINNYTELKKILGHITQQNFINQYAA